MKKYTKPATLIVHVSTQHMIADSVKFNSTAVDAYKAESRRGGADWDDEEE